MAKRPRPTRREAIGILNPFGDVWTTDVFASEAEAKRHLEHFWRGRWTAQDLEKFKFVPVRVTVSAIPQEPQNAE